MRYLRPELVQWYGLFGAAFAWTGQHLVGFGVAYSDCLDASRHWGNDPVTWMIVATVGGLACAGVAELAAVKVLLDTRRLSYDDAPPLGRRHFFAYGAALGNVLFIMAIALNCVGLIANATCRPA
ncbi:MAG: hypothetical protein ACJ74M_06180 [Gaiellaceae bacterium]